MKNKITLNKEKVKDFFASVIYERLQQRDGTFEHSNSDGLYSPSRWWFDKYDTSQGGYILQTSGEVATNKDANGQITVNVFFHYQKNPR